MTKRFLRFNKGATGEVLVDISDVRLSERASATVINLGYGDLIIDAAGSAYVQPIITITHTSDSTSSTIEAINEAIKKAFEPKTAPNSVIDPTLPSGITVSGVAFDTKAVTA